jgi:hypothetical protein
VLPEDDPEVDEFIELALREMFPKLFESAFAVSIMPGARDKPNKGDAKYWIELGASIMYEKPIILVVVEGAHIPQKLQKVADEIVVMDPNDMDSAAQDIQAAIERMIQ